MRLTAEDFPKLIELSGRKPYPGLRKMWREAFIDADYDTWGLWVD